MPWNKDGTRKESAFYLRSGNTTPFKNGKTKKKGKLKRFIKSVVLPVVKDPLLPYKMVAQSVKKVGTDVYKKIKAKKGPY